MKALVESVHQPHDLPAKLKLAQVDLQKAEAELAEMQAAVNAFRMHCRLKLDMVVERYLTLHTEYQSLLTQWQLHQQAQELSVEYDADDPFWRGEIEENDGIDDPLLPTPTPLDKAAEKRLYRALARRFHPDLGMTSMEITYRTEIMATINNAYAQGNVQALYDLAGELEPREVVQLTLIEDVKTRQLQKRILKCRQLQRKAQRKLTHLKQEQTTRLWKKAQALEEAGADWWEPVRREMEAACQCRQVAIDKLKKQLAETAPIVENHPSHSQ